MSYLNKMNEEVEDDKDINVMYHIFYGIAKHDLKNEVVHCFFEGEDSKYYISRINIMKKNKRVEIYDCKGKSNVLKLHDKIKASMETNNITKVYFIDKDFEEECNYDNDIYVTPCYSIENFYIQDSVMEQFISSEMKIRRSSRNAQDRNDYDAALNYFISERKKFIDRIKLLNAWYSIQNSYGVNLKSLKEIDISKEYDLEFLKENTPTHIQLSEIKLQGEIVRLSKDPLNLFRGKYFAQFLSGVINILVTKSAVDMNILSKVRKIKSNISKENIIGELSNYAITPDCLIKYLCLYLDCPASENAS